MSATRRGIIGGALAAPLLACLTPAAFGASADPELGRVSDAWVDLRWSKHIQDELDRLGVTVEPVAPATGNQNSGGGRVRFPVRSAVGDPSVDDPGRARGTAVLEGGLVLRTPAGEFRLADLVSSLEGETVSGEATVNGLVAALQSVFTFTVGEGRLEAAPVPPGRPMRIQVVGVPVRLTEASLEVFETTFGPSGLTTKTVLGHLTAGGVYTPPEP
ncbi:hypothetical protein ACLIYM_27615 [Streptomyces fenghuangensis]|uniref:hypothetical protein n=1 Tax=Streptomyces sp. ICN903 TaxID=2964654 RepID=UPI001ED9D4E4|nr:hypothetical protein [Streptomyces sp. ICN903]MCG3043512.1 hypothetical protein [Streptomyces sp. ICN903]